MRRRSPANAGHPMCAGAELYSLCHTAAADGALSSAALERLRAWLGRSAECDVPGLPFVRALVGHILRSGAVAPADLEALGQVLEPSLPHALRRRRSVPRFAAGDEIPYPHDRSNARARNDVLASASFPVVGCWDKSKAPRIPRGARVGEPVLLALEVSRAGVERAVTVRTAKGKRLGLVPAQSAKALAPLLDRGVRYRAHLIMVASGAHAPVLVVQAFVYRGDAELGFPQASARRIVPRRFSPLSWTLVRASVALAIAAATAFALRT